MFQYAAGRAVAFRNKTDLLLDTSWYKNIKGNTERKYSLGAFNIVERFASKKEIAAFRGAFFPLRAKLDLFKKEYIREKQFHFDPAITALSGDAYLDGYWQSEKYFKDAEVIIRKDFSLKAPLSRNAQEIADAIKKEGAVSVHVRRGDYVANASTHHVHGACSPEYYREAQKIIGRSVSTPHFFVFSDDVEWVRDAVQFDGPALFVSGRGVSDHEELFLMSLCQHHIIANSSFSWWGAWLNSAKDKIVIAPQKWFNNFDADTSDLIPASWKRV